MVNSKPRIAFCFSWQARTLDQTYLFFQKNLFNAAKKQWFVYDVFCAVEDDEDVNKVKLLNPTKVEKIKSKDVEIKKINKIYNNLHDKNLKYFDSEYLQFLIKSTLNQWYKIERSIELWMDYGEIKDIKYDIIFRLRFDGYFNNVLNFNNILTQLQLTPVIVNRFNFNPNRLRSISDYYFICTQSIVKKLKLIDNYKKVVYENISIRFLIPHIASKIILFFLKINHNIKILSQNTLEIIKKKYAFWVFVPEILLYKMFIVNDVKLKITSMNFSLKRKNWEIITLPLNKRVNNYLEINCEAN